MKRTPINPEPSPTSRGRGSALLLVIVSLTLMAMLGAAYIQMARVDRFSTREVNRENNIDSVVESAIAQIQSVLNQDIFDDNGQFFNPNDPNAGGGDEPHDYPYTDTIQDWEVTYRFPTNLSQPTATAKGGWYDDTWLASTTPYYGSNPDPNITSDDVWPHITNLNGIFLRNVGSAAMPTEDVVSFTGANNTDTNILLSDSSLVDADGDGIKDSRWTWAPSFKIGDLVYVMAVRIIDNSSLININAATAMTSDGLNGWGGPSTAPRGFFPTGIDLTRLLDRSPAVGVWSSSELPGLLNARTVSGIPTPFGLNIATFTANAGSRLDAWWFNTSLYGDPTNKFGINDELELRYHGGLNNPKFTSDAEAQMPTALLKDNSAKTYNDSDDPIASTTYQYFQGDDTNPGQFGMIKDRTYPAIRHMLTAFSGAAVFAPNHDDMNAGTVPVLKYDLVYQDGGSAPVNPTNPTNQDNRIGNIATLLNTLFTIDGPGVNNGYLGIQTNAPGQQALGQIANEFALAIQDYSDTDSTPSSWVDTSPNPDVTYYGMELLPFLREAYIQAGYEPKDNNNNDGDNDPNTGDFDTYEFETGSQAVAVELGNPFERDIPASLLNGRIRIAVFQGGTVTPVSSVKLAGLSSGISSHGQLIIYSNPTVPVDEGGVGSNLAGDLGLTGVALAAGSLTYNAGQDVTVALQVDVNPNAAIDQWVTYDRLTIEDFKLDSSYQINPVDPSATDAHGQGSVFRPCTNSTGGTPSVHYLSNVNKGLVAGAMRLPDKLGYRANQDALGDDDKGVNGHPMLDNFQLPLADRQFMSVAELGWIHMFGFYDDPGDPTAGDFPQRLSGLGPAPPTGLPDAASTRDPARWTLHLRETAWPGDSAIAVAVPTPLGIPHAAMVMDQFTTLSPRYDGVDNDNDDGDNNENTSPDNDQEQFAPGTININTVPLHTATLAAPLPENIDDVQDLMEAIAVYRDDNSLTNRASMTGLPLVRTDPGIASIGELMFINPPTNSSITTQYGRPIDSDTYQMQRYGNSNGVGPPERNLYPLPELSSTYNPNNSAEEAMARFQFLSQVFTTRSDIFTAYVVIQGFPAEDMSKSNGVPVEAIRFFAVFDRSGMTTATDRPRVLGVYGLD